MILKYTILFNLIIIFIDSYSFLYNSNIKRYNYNKIYLSNEFIENENNIETIIANKNDVGEVLEYVTKALSKVAPNNKDIEYNSDLNSQKQTIDQKFRDILNNIKESSLNDVDKSFLTSESEAVYNSVTSGETVFSPPKQLLSIPTFKTTIYKDDLAPVLLVYGKGDVGIKLKEIIQSLGKSVNFRLLEASYINIINDSELKYNLRDIKTVIIAADDVPIENKNWFGSSTYERKYSLTSKGLKKLLNAVMDEDRKNSDKSIKVVWYGSAIKPSKSLGSLIIGDESDIDSEFILLSQQRGLGYTSILAGNIISDDGVVPKNLKNRKLFDTTINQHRNSPIYFSPVKKIVESNEVTRVSAVCQSLLRASTFPNRNSTVIVLSTDSNEPINDLDWDDEFSKLDGPEIRRYPLLYTSIKQISLRVNRILSDFTTKGSELITPIELFSYSNGARVKFVPKLSNYLSSTEEKKNEKIVEDENLNIEKSKKVNRYISPEEEKRLEAQLKSNDQANEKSKPKSRKLEGGLEIIVDDIPYPRVRIRRFNMGPDTVIKEESENLIIKRIENAISSLENSNKLLTLK